MSYEMPSLQTYLRATSALLPSLLSSTTTTSSFKNILPSSHALNKSSPAATPQSLKLNFVMGNQASDADTIVSSIVLSYLLTLEQTLLPSSTTFPNTQVVHIPILPFPKSDFVLKPDTLLLLRLFGIETSTLLHIDDPSVTSHLVTDPSPSSSLTLTDHNQFAPSQKYIPPSCLQFWDERVTLILDHHEDNGGGSSTSHPQVTTDNRHIVTPLGSACTLVGERFFKTIAPYKPDSRVVNTILPLLLSVILLDTNNMNASTNKGTKRDRDCIDAITQYIASSDGGWSGVVKGGSVSPQAAHQHRAAPSFPLNDNKPDYPQVTTLLQDARFNPSFWSTLSPLNMIKLDYKRFGCRPSDDEIAVGISSILVDSEAFTNKFEEKGKETDDEVLAFMKEENIDLLVVMSMIASSKDSPPRREVLILSNLTPTSEGLVELLSDHFLTAQVASYLQFVSSEKTCKTDINRDAAGGRGGGSDLIGKARAFEQLNVKGSRKQVAPLITAFFGR
jgi:inorganic pyrophosphatase/exopolyphosphatase